MFNRSPNLPVAQLLSSRGVLSCVLLFLSDTDPHSSSQSLTLQHKKSS